MKVTLNYRYHEYNVIPPRCRKPRTVYDLEGKSTVTLKEARSKELIKVVTVKKKNLGGEGYQLTEFYHYGGKLYTRAQVSVSRNSDRPMMIYDLLEKKDRFSYSYSDTLANRRRDARRWASKYLIVDRDKVYIESGEPRWVIMTFGLGGNHGGSSICVHYGYNPNISKERYYRIDQKAAMYERYQQIALGRGDTKSVPYNFDYRDAIVHRPDLLRLNPTKEHGDGDSFINGIEAMISSVKDPLVSGLLVMGKAAALLNDSK